MIARRSMQTCVIVPERLELNLEPPRSQGASQAFDLRLEAGPTATHTTQTSPELCSKRPASTLQLWPKLLFGPASSTASSCELEQAQSVAH